MGLLILEPQASIDAPGTGLLEEVNTQAPPQADIQRPVKHVRGRPDLVLIPSPSDDPSDPLNWSQMRKECCFATLLLGTVLAGVIGPLVAPANVALVTELDQSLANIAQITGAFVLTIGIGSVMWAPVQIKYGSRPTFILTASMMFISSIWAGASKGNYASLIGARSVQGLASGAYFSGVPGVIQNLYFVHERGLRVSLWNLSLVGGVNVGPIISAQIIEKQGWTFAFWWMSLAVGLVLVATVFFAPETVFDRTALAPIAVVDHRTSVERAEKDGSEKESALAVQPLAKVESGDRRLPACGFWASLAPFSGSKSDESFLAILCRPFKLICTPAVVWGSVMFSTSFNLYPLAATVYAQIFSAAPYNFSTGAIGIISGIPALIGTLIGTLVFGPLSDWLCQRLAKRNGGVYEPEFRLVLLVAFAVFGGMGAFGWGLTTAAEKPWIVTCVFIVIFHVGVAAGTSACIGYVSDSSASSATDAVGMVVLIKSFIGFGILFFANDWYAARGPKQFFVSLGSLIVAVSALGFPMWVLGKRARAWSRARRMI